MSIIQGENEKTIYIILIIQRFQTQNKAKGVETCQLFHIYKRDKGRF